MTLFKDIYYRIDLNLVEQNYHIADIKEKKQLIDDELKKYIISKLNESNNTKLLPENQEELSVQELLLILSRSIPKEERIDPSNHVDSLSHFTHYILNIAGNLQNYSIIWWCEKDEELVKNPKTLFDENGLWNSLTTSIEPDYVETFRFVYDIFTNNFMKKKNPKKLLLEKQEQEDKKDS